jgi:hypothetical protein
VIIYELAEGEGGVVSPQRWHTPGDALRHERQQRVSCVRWQPNGGPTLAVGGRGGVCLWGVADTGKVPARAPPLLAPAAAAAVRC